MARRLFVEGRCHDLGLGVAGHLGHLLRALVDQQHDDVYFGMVVGDGVDDRLHEHRLTRLGLCYDQCALPLADGRKEVDHARRHVVVSVAREAELLAREERRHEFELYAVADELRRQAVDLVHAYQRKIFLPLLRRAYGAVHRVAGLQSEEFDLRRRNVNVVGRVQVVVVGRTQEPVSVGHDLQHAFALDLPGEIVLGDHLAVEGLRIGCCCRGSLGCLGSRGCRGGGFCCLFLCLCLCLGLAAAALGLRLLLAGCLYGFCRWCRCRGAFHRELRLGGGFGDRYGRTLCRSGVFGLRIGDARPAAARGLGNGFGSGFRLCGGRFGCGCRLLHFRCGSFLFSAPSSLLFIFCGDAFGSGAPGDFLNQFALLQCGVPDTDSFCYFTQFDETFPFERFQILHIFLFQNDFQNPGGRRDVGICLQR